MVLVWQMAAVAEQQLKAVVAGAVG